jgi:hypothetical protein
VSGDYCAVHESGQPPGGSGHFGRAAGVLAILDLELAICPEGLTQAASSTALMLTSPAPASTGRWLFYNVRLSALLLDQRTAIKRPIDK